MKKHLIFLFAIFSLATFASCENPPPIDNYDSSLTETGDGAIEIFEDTPPITNSKEMKTTPTAGDTIATLKTSMGEIKLLLYTEEAPETTENFISHATSERYNNVIFHRVIDDFMIQTGDFEFNNGMGGYPHKGPDTYLEDEFGEGLTHVRGAVSMANAGPNTGGSQFFIVQNQDGTIWLDGRHAIFGYIFEGMATVDKIASAETLPGDKPKKDIIIESVEISTY